MRSCKCTQHYWNLKKLEAFSLIHGLQSKNNQVQKDLNNGALEEKKLEHVIVGELEDQLLLQYKGGLEVQNKHKHALKQRSFGEGDFMKDLAKILLNVLPALHYKKMMNITKRWDGLLS